MTEKKMSDQELLESLSTYDEMLDHKDNCGMCFHMQCMAQAARDIIATGDISDAISRWDKQTKTLWEEGKYFKLWKEEQAASRDPHKAFADRGWEP
jgi:hypothetical protein